VLGGLRAEDRSTAIGSVGTLVQVQHLEPTAGVVPVVHAITGGQPVAPGVTFVGRQEETKQLLGTLAPSDGGTVPLVVSAVAGMGGIGKTALARFCAAEAVARGWFPGGAYVVDLQGYSPSGMVSRDALFAPLLHQFGVPAEEMPAEPSTQACMYDKVLRQLAQQGHRVLLVLDNASTAAQVDGLVPTTGDHRVVVTTRDTLAIPGARRLDLDVLAVVDALELLDEALREHDPDDTRAAETEAATLVGVCGLLPLAVRVAAGLLADEPDTSCVELATELANTPADGFTHGETRIASVLAASINHLAGRDPQAARLLRLLPLNPGLDISTEAAAALCGLPVAAARASLRALRQAHLIIPSERRWRLHDLIRRYLLGQGIGSEEREATTRLLEYYATTARAADEHLQALPDQTVADLFPGRDQALAWFDAEHAVLVATVQWAATNHPTHTTRLADALDEYQSWRRHLNDRLTVCQTALDACRRASDLLGEGVMWNHLGVALRESRRFEEAVTAHERAREIFREIDHQHGEGSAWSNLGLALQELRRFEEALTSHERAHDILREIGDQRNEVAARNNMGLALKELRRFDEAVTAYEHVLTDCQAIGDRRGEGLAWANLSIVLRELERLDETIAAQKRARDIFQEIGDRHSEGKSWYSLGVSWWLLQKFDEARRCLDEALDVFIEFDDTNSARDVMMMVDNLDIEEEIMGR
jgi:tetratricopeptide (TPR) repeat protein